MGRQYPRDMTMARAATAVAARAAELAGAGGVDLPDDLALWRLAGGRPEVAARAGEPEELGELLEASLDPCDRRSRGVHHTPRPLAAELAARALIGRERPRVGDPSCGGGALLLAAARILAERGERPGEVVGRLYGLDVDPLAVATTEVALTLWAREPVPAGNVLVADALTQAPAWPHLDVVVGNPPFLSPLDAGTGPDHARAVALRGRFGDAARAYTDVAGLFLLVAIDLAGPGATVALLQPQSVLGARDAAGVRERIGERARLVDVWCPPTHGFDAAVDVCVPMLEVGATSRSSSWSAHLARANGVPPVDLPGERTLGDEAATTAGFRSEYYGLALHVHEQDACPRGLPVVTTGLVDLIHCAWGERPARIGGTTWDRPVVDAAALDGRAAGWVRRTGGPKLVVATQTKVVEVVVDEDGAWIAGVPLVVVLAPSERLWPLAAALASPAATAWLLQRAAGTALTPHSLKVSAPLLRDLPLPTDDAAWAAGTVALQAGELDAFGEAMAAAYGTASSVSSWWLERAKPVWSPNGAHR